MPKQNIIIFLLTLILSGCASNSALNKKADNDEKAGDYYESIGQPEAAERSRKMAQDNRDDSLSFEAILVDLLFGKDDK